MWNFLFVGGGGAIFVIDNSTGTLELKNKLWKMAPSTTVTWVLAWWIIICNIIFTHNHLYIVFVAFDHQAATVCTLI